MATIRKFEDVKAWQEGRALVRAIYALTGRGAFSRDFGFKDQIQRAAVSICSNIAEGFETDSHAELVRYLGYAKGSAGEVLSQLTNAYDIGYIDDERFEDLSEKDALYRYADFPLPHLHHRAWTCRQASSAGHPAMQNRAT